MQRKVGSIQRIGTHRHSDLQTEIHSVRQKKKKKSIEHDGLWRGPTGDSTCSTGDLQNTFISPRDLIRKRHQNSEGRRAAGARASEERRAAVLQQAAAAENVEAAQQ